MNSGKLRHRIEIQQKTATQDTFGAPVDTWAEFATVWAEIKPASSTDRVAFNQATAPETTHKVNIRYLAGVTSDMRVMFGSRVFEITAPPLNWDERNKELTLMCRELS